MRPLLLLLGFFILFASCFDFTHGGNYLGSNIAGYKAVYSQDPEIKKIKFLSPKQMISPGKIYVKDKMILQNDIGLGIHLYNANEPSQLKDLGFIQIAGNVELSIKGNFLYANSYEDLVVINLANWTDLKEVKRIPKAFVNQSWNQANRGSFVAMPEKNAYYECVDNQKGMQTGWIRDTISNNCFFYHQ